MPQSEWQRRIARAEELGAQYSFAAEILRFYVTIARFQDDFYRQLDHSNRRNIGAAAADIFAHGLPAEFNSPFRTFLSVVEQAGPAVLQDAARQVRERGQALQSQLLATFWQPAGREALPPGPSDFFARAFLQPYAVAARTLLPQHTVRPAPYLCPFCQRKPGLGVLRPLGDGGQRSLICSFCLAEWGFRRILCPGCGEEDYAKLPVYTAAELDHVRVEACDSCRTYIKTVDMTKAGLAEPVVDEMAAIPLDLWAEKQGYTKLQTNLLQL
ncbi:MAG: formate dehydrogenase accessory protein FdhE [Terriglobales bacterium]